jgi:hypothetical protein
VFSLSAPLLALLTFFGIGQVSSTRFIMFYVLSVLYTLTDLYSVINMFGLEQV